MMIIHVCVFVMTTHVIIQMTEYRVKDLGKPKYRLLLQLEHLHSYIVVYYVVYIHNILEKFIVDKSYPSITLMVVHSLDVEKDLLDQR